MNIQLLSKFELFKGMSLEEIELMCKCLTIDKKTYKKGEIILHNGDTITSVALVSVGQVSLEFYDILGNKNIINIIPQYGMFAESYAALPGFELGVTVTASENCEILFVDITNIISLCDYRCSYHTRLIANLLGSLAKKNIALSKKIAITMDKSIRDRVVSFLTYEKNAHGSNDFMISLNRQEMADYLRVDRSALSKELGKMKKDGLIDFHKNHFIIKDFN